MILISGSSEREIVDLQQGDYEEMDQLNAAKPYAKASYRINKAEDIGIGWQRILSTVKHYGQLEPALLGKVEELIDFLTTEDYGFLTID